MIPDTTQIKIYLDDTAKDTKVFKSLECLHLNKQELFKYAILCWEVPSHIKECDYFDNLQSKVPGLEMMISDFIQMTEFGIKNLSNDDRVKKIVSEFIGVGIGLKYSAELLKINPNMFRKIPPPSEGKYLDYSVIVEGKEYEIETKGTVGSYYTSMKDDIIRKKSNETDKVVYLRFGTIAMIINSDDNSTIESRCVVVDDPPTNSFTTENDTFQTQFLHYSLLLSYILDSKYYNKFVRPLLKGKIDKAKINSSKFFGRYYFNGKMFLGEYFDYRLYKGNYGKYFNLNLKNKDIFKILTKEVGRTKIFVGLEIEVINRLNDKDSEFFKNYSCQEEYVREPKVIKFLDKDGILIIKSLDSSDNQIEEIFSEKVVEGRLGLSGNYQQREWHRCGAPCKSRGIEGKPCEIKTFRSHCHFHR